MIHTLTLLRSNPVKIVTDHNGREYAQVQNGQLSGDSVSPPTTPATIENHSEVHSEDWIYKVNDAQVITDAAAITYWGVTEKRPK